MKGQPKSDAPVWSGVADWTPQTCRYHRYSSKFVRAVTAHAERLVKKNRQRGTEYSMNKTDQDQLESYLRALFMVLNDDDPVCHKGGNIGDDPLCQELIHILPSIVISIETKLPVMAGIACYLVETMCLVINVVKDSVVSECGVSHIGTMGIRSLLTEWLPALTLLLPSTMDDTVTKCCRCLATLFAVTGAHRPFDRGPYEQATRLKLAEKLVAGMAGSSLQSAIAVLAEMLHPTLGPPALLPFSSGGRSDADESEGLRDTIDGSDMVPVSVKSQLVEHVVDCLISRPKVMEGLLQMLSTTGPSNVVAMRLILQCLRGSNVFRLTWQSTDEKGSGLRLVGPLMATWNAEGADQVPKSLAAACIHALVKESTALGTSLGVLANVFNNRITQAPCLVGSYACLVLSELLRAEAHTSDTIHSAGSMKSISERVDGVGRVAKTIIQSQRLETVRQVLLTVRPEAPPAMSAPLEGASFGRTLYGILDGYLLLLKALMDGYGDMCRKWLALSGITEALLSLLGEHHKTALSHVSPQGVEALLSLVRAVLEDRDDRVAAFLRHRTLEGVLKVLHRRRLVLVEHWPSWDSEAQTPAVLVTHACELIRMCLEDTPDATNRVHQLLFTQEAVHDLLECTPFASALTLTLGLLCQLVLALPHFGQQFLSCGGISHHTIGAWLRPGMSDKVVIDVLMMLSQLARQSEKSYEPLLAADIMTCLRPYLDFSTPASTNPVVRAKACNLLGNLCRHSSAFYPTIIENDVMKHVTLLCEDQDAQVRKFATFAVGNASFHDDTLYEPLRPCIPALCKLMFDESSKTRTNAAGAVGNLARNSAALAEDLLEARAPQLLIKVARSDEDPPRSIAVFSLGTLYSIAVLQKAMMESGLLSLMAELSELTDPSVVKCVSRLRQKMG